MRIFLIDFENVKSKGLTGIDKLEKDDTVVILYSENSDTISFEMHKKVMACKAEVEYFKVHVGGKNALDFQLSTLLGYVVARNAFSHAFIISNDRGFDFLHDFWHGHYVEGVETVVYRSRTISQALSYALGAKQAPQIDPDDIDDETDDEIAETEVESVEMSNLAAEAASSVEQLAEIVSGNDEKKAVTEVKATKRPRGYMPNLTHILQEVCTDEQIREISRLLSESETKEELHNSLAKIYKQQATDFYKLIRPRYLRLKQLYLKENPDAEQAKPVEAEVETPKKDKLTEMIENSVSAENTSEAERIKKCVLSAQTKQQLYIRMVKEFGKDKGCSIYKELKGSCEDLLSAAKEN